MHDDLVITVSPSRDWFTVYNKGEVIAAGHHPSVFDIKFILEYFGHNNGDEVKIVEVSDA
jgi:hypothetical protein